MTLPEYLKSLTADELTVFANTVGTSVGYLKTQLAYGHKNIGPEMALRMQDASQGVLDAKELCPDFPWDTAAEILCNCVKHTI